VIDDDVQARSDRKVSSQEFTVVAPEAAKQVCASRAIAARRHHTLMS
jgi:hypothetical protein